MVLKLAAALGLRFDCATEGEIKNVLSIKGVQPNCIIYANPVKMVSHIKYAASVNVNLTVFDSECELMKLKKLYPTSDTLLRIRYDAADSKRCLGLKFGCDPDTEAPKLLQTAKTLGVNVVGVCFHVGSYCRIPKTYYDAIAAAKKIFDVGKDLGIHMKILDIGGGFPGEADATIVKYAEYINKAIDEYFPDQSVKILSEPGTYFVSSAFTLACQIHTTKLHKVTESGPEYGYYINDGIYGSFAAVTALNAIKIPKPLINHSNKQTFLSTIWGPTLDSGDKIISNILLPKLEVGEWVTFENCGEYSLVGSTNFNAFRLADVYGFVNHQNSTWIKKQKQFLEDVFISEPL